MAEDDLTAAADLPEEAAAAAVDSAEEGSSFARRYPPLLSILAGILIALFVLPSALNLPQTNPTQTLEYAPVPPEDDDNPPPPPGNLDQLGLGSSNGLAGDGAPGGEGSGSDVADLIRSKKEQNSTMRCIKAADGVIRQTEDPLAPPCVPFFDGDNFGATYQGVTGDEFRVLLYFDGAITLVGTSQGTEDCPSDKLYDLLVPADPNEAECPQVRQARLWQTYFNTRYQTYGRLGHFFVYYGHAASSTTPETRQADAAEAFRLVEPFATLDFSEFSGASDSFVYAFARRGVLNFGQFAGQKQSFFTEFPKLVWGYLPSQDLQLQMYASMLCNHYVGRPVEHSGQFDGPRKFGLVYTSDPGYESLRQFKDQLVQRFEDCGGVIADEGVHPQAGYTVSTSTSPRYATEVMSRFKLEGVTTIIWPGGLETNYSKAAANLGYFPEWVLYGDGDLDSQFANQAYGGRAGQDQNVWQYAVVMSPQARVPDSSADTICFQAQRSVDPDTPKQDAGTYGCDMYDNLRQLFTGIQVAGPRLGPTSIDKGFHAIPPVPSLNLEVPSCYYLPGDYTCIKDYVIGRYDPQGKPAGPNGSGCYRIVGSRRRDLNDNEQGPVQAGYNPGADPCLNYGNGFRSNTGAPDPTKL